LLNEFASKLFDEEKNSHSQYRRRLNLNTPAGNSFCRYLSFIWNELCREDFLLTSPMVTKEIEDSLYAMFVYASVDACRSFQPRRNFGGLLGHARRAEAYIMENFQESISAADIASKDRIKESEDCYGSPPFLRITFQIIKRIASSNSIDMTSFRRRLCPPDNCPDFSGK
jgi:hypothetical protein